MRRQLQSDVFDGIVKRVKLNDESQGRCGGKSTPAFRLDRRERDEEVSDDGGARARPTPVQDCSNYKMCLPPPHPTTHMEYQRFSLNIQI